MIIGFRNKARKCFNVIQCGMTQPHIPPINVRCFFGKSAFRAIGVLVLTQLSQILLLITMDNFHFFSFLPALCRTQRKHFNGGTSTSMLALARTKRMIHGRRIIEAARQKAGYI